MPLHLIVFKNVLGLIVVYTTLGNLSVNFGAVQSRQLDLFREKCSTEPQNIFMSDMASFSTDELYSVDFEVFGRVQGVYFI